MAHVYVIHFNNKLHRAGHYLGYSTCLPHRIESHRNSTGAKLRRAVNIHLTDNTIVSSSNMLKDYDPYVDRVKKGIPVFNPARYAPPIEVARKIMPAATDRNTKMRYLVGNARVVLLMRKLLP